MADAFSFSEDDIIQTTFISTYCYKFIELSYLVSNKILWNFRCSYYFRFILFEWLVTRKMKEHIKNILSVSFKNHKGNLIDVVKNLFGDGGMIVKEMHLISDIFLSEISICFS